VASDGENMTAQLKRAHRIRFVLLMAFLAIAAALVMPPAASAAISFVQVNSATPHTSQSTVAVTYTAAQSAGNLNIVVIGWGDNTRNVTSVTDSKGNAYTQVIGRTVNTAGAISQTIYYAKNIAAATAASNTVTVIFDGAAVFPDVRILEYNGVDTGAPVDVTAVGTGSGNTSTTAAVTTTNATDMLFATNVVSTVNTGAGTGFTSRIITPDGNIAEDRMVSAIGSYTATAGLASGQWVAQMVAFRAAGSVPDSTPPSAPASLAATPISATQVNLAWTASTDNIGVAGYRVERCQGSVCTDFTQILTPTGTSVSDTGVVTGTTYNYRVRAVDGAGNLSDYSNTATATTPAPDTIPPTAPSSLLATAASGTQINLAWTASTDNIGIAQYRIERCQGVGCSNFVQVLTSTGTSISNTGLTNGTNYSYRVLAVDAAGNPSAYSNVASVSTLDTAAPTAPSGLTATAAGSTQVNLAWTASTDNVGVAQYRVERCQGSGCTTFTQVLTPTVNSATDTGLTAGTLYRYRVRAADAAGNLSSYSSTVNVTTGTATDATPPTAPTNFTATPVSGTQINLAWTASTDNVGVTGYRVERCQGAGCSTFTQVLTPTGTSVSNTGLTNGTNYSYRVRAVDAAGNLSPYSSVASASTLDTAAPTAPSGLIAAAAGTSQINLNWTASTDNVGVTQYRVERCQGAGCTSFAQVLTPAGTSVSDTGLTASTTYLYRVRAADAAGNLSGYSATMSATTQAAPDTTPPTVPGTLTATAISGTQINLAWTASTDNVGVTGYQVERCQDAGCSNFVQVFAPTGTSVSDTSLTSGTSYSYRVRATDLAGNLSAYSNVATATPTADTVPPTAPSNFTATAVSTSQINLAWTASTDNVGVTGYRVERCQGPGCSNFAQVLTPTGTSVSDTGLAASTSYSYRVRAVDGAGNLGAYSSTATSTTFVSTGTITFVQVKDGAPHSAQSTVAVAYPSAQSAGNLNVVVVGWGDTVQSVLSVTDSKGNVYTPAVGPTINSAAGLSQTVFFAKNIAAAAAGANTVTVTFDGAAAFPDIRILEYSGVDVSTPVDVTAQAIGNGSTSSTPAVATTNAVDLLFATNVVATVSTAAGSGFTSRIISPDGNIAEDRMVTATGSYSATATLNSGQWVMQMVAFRASGSPPPPPDTVPPTNPSGLTATALGTQINLAWAASTDNVAVTGYRVERCQGAGCSNFVQVATPTGTGFADTGLLTSTSFSYRVRAVDAAGNLSGYSNVATASTSSAASNPVVIENQLPGSNAWQLGDLYGRPYANDTAGQIKGYASATSINKGENISFHVSVNPAQTYTIDVYRMGWYGGLGGRLMQHIGPLNGVQETRCPVDATTGLIECNWSVGYTLTTQDTWTSGIYLAVLKNAQGFYNYMTFTVRDDSRIAALMYQQPVTTYQAYNDYPADNATGKSLYEINSFGPNTMAGTVRAVKVSFDRPYSEDGAGKLIWLSELNTLRWLEKSGYDVTYSTNLDTHENGARLLSFRGFLSLPHDEYWSKQMYDAAAAARDAGVNLAFLGANSVFWQIRFEPSRTGVADRIIVCYKEAALDPNPDSTVTTVNFRNPPVNRSEQALEGVEFTDGPNSGTASMVITNSSNWVYAGTGLTDGTVIPGLVWYEADRQVAGDPLPNAVPGTYVMLSNSPYAGSNGPEHANSSIYQAPSGAWVFASGTMGWGWGLDNFYPEGSVTTVDSRIQKATANVLDRFGGR